MTQQQTENKVALLSCAAIMTAAMSPIIAGQTHDSAEALMVTQHERWYNFLLRALLPNGATAADGTVGHPPGVYDDPPDVDPAAFVNSINATALQTLAGKLAPLLAVIPGVGPVAAATASAIAASPPIGMPSKPA